MNTDKLRELLAKAASGPWFYESLTAGHAITSGETVVAFCGPKKLDDLCYARNAELIAAMHESLPELLDEMDRLRKDAERFRWLLSRISYQDGTDGMAWATMEWCVERSCLAPANLDAAIDAAIAAQEVE